MKRLLMSSVKVSLSLLFIFCVSIQAFSQRNKQSKPEEIFVPRIEVTVVGGSDLSPEMLKEKAIKEAKLNALHQAGLEEHISVYENYYISETKGNFEELFTSDIISDIRGGVKEFNVKSAIPRFLEEGMGMELTLTAEATVVKFNEERDITFDYILEGLRLFYRDGEDFMFTIRSSKPAYVRVFLLSTSEENVADILFPNSYEPDVALHPDSTTTFPIDTVRYHYPMSTTIKEDPHKMIVVLLKQKIPFLHDFTFEDIARWIVEIPPSQRVVKTFAFTIVKD